MLEVGTGSGYQAAVLSRLAREVVSIERYRTLAEQARARLAALGYDNVEVVVGDGFAGVPEKAPYDRIIVTAAAEQVPQALLDQLARRRGDDFAARAAWRTATHYQAYQIANGDFPRKPDCGAFRAVIARAGAGIVTFVMRAMLPQFGVHSPL